MSPKNHRWRSLFFFLINIARYSAVSVTRVNGIAGAKCGIRLDPRVRPGSFALPVSFVPTLSPFSVSPFIRSLSLSFSSARARSRSPSLFLHDRPDPVPLSLSPSATMRACVWVRGSAVELVNGRTRTRSPLLASAARSLSVRALRGHREVLVSQNP